MYLIKVNLKCILSLFLLFSSFATCHGQIIKGIILDKFNGSKINFASVYINGTYIGTNSDQNGNFELDVSKFTSQPVTISALGYYSVSLTDFSVSKPITVYLVPKVFELNEVVVLGKSLEKEKKRNLKAFREEFLGRTYNGQNCVILNEQDIKFNNGSSDDTLKAFASKPIIIFNNGLGYKVTYYLDKFEYYRKSNSYLYKGSAIFNEDLALNPHLKHSYERQRTKSYLGSRKHFFVSLWADRLRSNSYFIKNSINETMEYDDIVSEGADHKKYIKKNELLTIYYGLGTPKSFLKVVKDKVFFDRNGYYDGSGIEVEGFMAIQRVGDLLPYEYRPAK